MSTGLMLLPIMLVVLLVVSLIISLYGIYICFKAKWYIGAASLLLPGFAFTVGFLKLIFKVDLLK